ncbi:MAG: hypothetical protein UT11_C0045G0008 [Berkelbacteria bacterium GW2011_GWA2_38_9]|uniref:Uncharacterized protein n=1 Tax=Berkelbacteria bacterium GW2011_GWA2_38_9 TaxID=1618334 RepID=A0A0G0LA49_9BACT|nr:MAG: hypothetical protein UT11_C0045G0008 [Berkelbacteria bacterium GW2011_GWA2_38_9]
MNRQWIKVDQTIFQNVESRIDDRILEHIVGD